MPRPSHKLKVIEESEVAGRTIWKNTQYISYPDTDDFICGNGICDLVLAVMPPRERPPYVFKCRKCATLSEAAD